MLVYRRGVPSVHLEMSWFSCTQLLCPSKASRMFHHTLNLSRLLRICESRSRIRTLTHVGQGGEEFEAFRDVFQLTSHPSESMGSSLHWENVSKRARDTSSPTRFLQSHGPNSWAGTVVVEVNRNDCLSQMIISIVSFQLKLTLCA